MGNGMSSDPRLNAGEGFPLLHKPLVEKHVIQTCNLDNGLSTQMHHEDDPELEKLTRSFPNFSLKE